MNRELAPHCVILSIKFSSLLSPSISAPSSSIWLLREETIIERDQLGLCSSGKKREALTGEATELVWYAPYLPLIRQPFSTETAPLLSRLQLTLGCNATNNCRSSNRTRLSVLVQLKFGANFIRYGQQSREEEEEINFASCHWSKYGSVTTKSSERWRIVVGQQVLFCFVSVCIIACITWPKRFEEEKGKRRIREAA